MDPDLTGLSSAVRWQRGGAGNKVRGKSDTKHLSSQVKEHDWDECYTSDSVKVREVDALVMTAWTPHSRAGNCVLASSSRP